MNSFQWTVDSLTLYGHKLELVPPLGHLPRYVHLRQWGPEEGRREVSAQTRAKLSAASSAAIANKPTTASRETATKYLHQIHELMATGLNQKETADRLGIHPTAVSRLLSTYPNGL